MISPVAPTPEKLVSVTDARATLSRLIEVLRENGERAEPVFIGKHGQPMAVLVSLERFHEYCALLALREQEFGIASQEAGTMPATPATRTARAAGAARARQAGHKSQVSPTSEEEPDPPTPRVRVIGPYHTKPHEPGDFRDVRGE